MPVRNSPILIGHSRKDSRRNPISGTRPGGLRFSPNSRRWVLGMRPSFYPQDFGKAAEDYARYRKGFPDSFFKRLLQDGIGMPGQSILDLGTGTGSLARGFAR